MPALNTKQAVHLARGDEECVVSLVGRLAQGENISHSNAVATLGQSTNRTQRFFEKHLNPVMLVFIG